MRHLVLSRHFPELPDVINGIFDLMQLIDNSELEKEFLYKHFLRCADFAVGFLNSNVFYQFAKHLDTNMCLSADETLEEAMRSNSFLRRAEIIDACFDVVRSNYLQNSEEMLVTLLRTESEVAEFGRVMLDSPSTTPQGAVFFSPGKLDVSLSFILQLLYGYMQSLVLEAFEQYENIDLKHFPLKELVFNAQSAQGAVTFWFPAFSAEDKCVLEARYIENAERAEIARDESDLQRQLAFTREMLEKSELNRRGVYSVEESAPENGAQISERTARVIAAEEASTKYELLRQDNEQLAKRIAELEGENSILAASQQKLILDFEKMFEVVEELSRSVKLLSKREK